MKELKEDTLSNVAGHGSLLRDEKSFNSGHAVD